METPGVHYFFYINVPALMSAADPADRARLTGQIIGEMQDAITDLGHVRCALIVKMLSDGMSQREVARQVGISQSRISQIAARSSSDSA